MKTYSKILSCLLITGILFFSACTNKFEEYNIDERGVTDKQIQSDYYFIGGFFPQMQQMIYCNFNWGWGNNWTYQIMQNLNADIFSGYMMTPTAFAGNVNNTTYALVDGWNGSAWDYTYAYFMTAENQVEKITKDDYPSFYATALILKVAAMHRISDLYGPIIYTHYGDSKTGGQFDSQKDAYYAFFEDLKTAVTLLDEFVKQNPEAKPFVKYDQLFEGDYTQWIKFANSLRLRLAIRISDVEPAKAKTEAEAALANSYGVLETKVAQVSGKGYTNPVAAISNSWGDILMGAPMESILTGYNDPRIKKFFNETADPDAKSKGYAYKGIRQGINLTDNVTYRSHSSINLTAESPGILMTAAEVYFLRAEGALKGWSGMGGTAKELYELGVNTSFEQWGASGAADYLTSSNVAAPYVDIKAADGVNDVLKGSNYLNNVSPAWDEATSDEQRLQKIITQKWIATFPEGMEAWSEFRRTGYPKLFPVVLNLSDGKISTEGFVKRLNFSVTEKSSNEAGYNQAVEMLNGPDTGGTPLWWDID